MSRLSLPWAKVLPYSRVIASQMESEARAPVTLIDSDITESTEKADLKAAQNAAIDSAERLHILCFLLHVILISFHIILLIAYHLQLDRGIIKTDPEDIARMSLIKTVSSQSFAIIYLAIVLYITQRVALASSIPYDSVTALHDKLTSWSGLGAASMTLIQQFWAVTSPRGVASIALYLLLTAGLKITTPALVDVVPITVSHQSPLDAYMPLVNLSGLTFSDDLLQQAVGTVPFLNKDGRVGMPAIGLEGNIIYPALEPSQGTGEINVAASAIEVKCSGRHSSDATVSRTSVNARDTHAPFYFIADPVLGSFHWSSMARNIVHWVDSTQSLWMFTLPIEDSLGGSTPAIPINPSMNVVFDNIFFSIGNNRSDPDFRRYDELQHLGKIIPRDWDDLDVASVAEVTFLHCSLDIADTVVSVDPQRRTLAARPQRDSYRVWGTGESMTDITSWWGNLFRVPNSRMISGSAFCHANRELKGFQIRSARTDETMLIAPSSCGYLTLADKFVMDLLGLDPFSHFVTQASQLAYLLDDTYTQRPNFTAPTPKTVKLHEFEQALENYTAAMIWAIGQINNTLQDQSVNVGVMEPASELQLIFLPIIAGLALSIGLLILTPLVTITSFRRLRRSERGGMSSLGVLETIWLAKNDTRFIEAGNAIEKVEVPLVENLRAAFRQGDTTEAERLLRGMESELMRRRAHTSDND